MKLKLTALIGALFLSAAAFAQDEPETLLGKHVKVSGFGAPIVEFSSINNQFTVSTGGGGAVLLNQKFFFGGYGLGRSNSVKAKNPDQKIGLGHGGFWLGYNFNPHKLLHITASAKMGWGNVSLYDNDFNARQNFGSDNVYVVTPEVGAEINITGFMKIAVAGGYRMVNGVAVDGYNNADFSSPTASVSFKFGFFGQRIKQ
ncbi:hypothetical protein [Rhodoflexus caldus]|uniref:hypothetical protein n=1 Tax=Rhodoflexus caldus TaxID=2891236 RepID=UPI00202A14F8|nr:hypothetical protein [Rhodoflexus caldus]